jgi:Fe-S-cluster-containing hydrogenase component 2
MELSCIDIIYFSPTGNCEKIAYHLKNRLRSFTINLYNITSPSSRENIHFSSISSLLIFIFPVYAQDMPSIMKRFIENLHNQSTPVVLITVYGNISIGRALYYASTSLENKGFSIVGAGALIGEHSFNHNKLHIAPNEPSSSTLQFSNELIDTVIDKLANFSSLKECAIAVPKSYKNAFAFLPERFLNALATPTPKYFSHLCTKCTVCKNHCPADAIDDNYSIDASKCIHCFSCVKRCPNNAYTMRIRTPITLFYLKHYGKKLKAPKLYY